jgi:hypothetical protein
MGICRYCGQKAGWFREVHDACVAKANSGIEAIKICVAEAIVQGEQYSEIKRHLDQTTSDSAIPQAELLPAIKDGWSRGAEKRGMAQPISDSEFSSMSDVYRAAGLTPEEMRTTAGFKAIVFSFLIWTVLNDQIEPYQGPIQFNLQTGEVPVFGMANVLVREERTTSSYVGGYSGASIRVASGLYYHLGGVRGHREQSASLQEVDYGDFLMTTQAVYFSGTEKGVNFRLPYSHIIKFQPYSDAVGICKNGGKEKIFAPQHGAESGWFLFNVLQALAAKDSGTKSHQSSVTS